MSNKIEMVELRTEGSNRYSLIRTVCNLLGFPREDTALKLYSLIKDLCHFKDFSTDIRSLDRYMDKSDLFKNDRRSQLHMLEKIGLIHLDSKSIVFNRVLYNPSNDWDQKILDVKFVDNQLIIENVLNGIAIVKSDFSVDDYITCITNLQKRQAQSDPVISKVLDLFVKNELTGDEQLKTDKALINLSVDMGYGKELLRTKLSALMKTGLVLEYDEPFRHLYEEDGVVYKPSKYYLNSELFTLDEYNYINPLNKAFDVVIKKKSATFTKRN